MVRALDRMSSPMNLEALGWNSDLAREFAKDGKTEECPARVFATERGYVRVVAETGAFRAMLTGHARSHPPAVGDWVYLQDGDPPTVRDHLGRASELLRKTAGASSKVQCIAANIDVVFIVTDHDRDLNPRRLERYVTAVQAGKSRPVVVLNKADQDPAAEQTRQEVARSLVGIDVVSISAQEGFDPEILLKELEFAQTAVVVGSSGVGKSTITTLLTGEQQRIGTVDIDGKGRHTTTSRSMFPLPGGKWLVDTPGMREFGLADVGQQALAQTFEDIIALEQECKFSDCSHEHEPGCAVAKAVRAGDLAPQRLASFEKLRREASHQRARTDAQAARERKQRDKQFAKKYRKPNQAKARKKGDI